MTYLIIGAVSLVGCVVALVFWYGLTGLPGIDEVEL